MGYLAYAFGLAVAVFASICAFCSWNPVVIFNVLLLQNYNYNSEELTVAYSWKRLIAKPTVSFKRIAVGVNGDVDLIVKGTTLLKLIDEQSNATSTPHVDHSALKSIQDLKETFGYFHQKGAGGERSMEKLEDFQEVLAAARSISNAQYFIGGNAALIAQKLSSMVAGEGRILFSCPVGPVLKTLLDPAIQVTESAFKDQDEYHIILEYSKGERWDGKVAPVASRFIFSHDVGNSKMSSFEALISGLDEFEPDLLVLSGFHMLEANKPSDRSKRLDEIAQLLRPLSTDVPIHLELASMSSNSFVEEINAKILPLVDSIGLNEQELWLLCQADGGPHCGPDSPDGPPLVSQAADISVWLLRSLSRVSGSRTSRVHFHTLTYHISLTLAESRWRNLAPAVLAGTRTAANQACDDDAASRPDKFQLRLAGRIQLSALDADRSVDFEPSSPVVSWRDADDIIDLHLSPVLVCKEPVKTVGLGDAISATGLLFSQFLR